MQGINAYQLPMGLPQDAEVVDIGGFAYLYLPGQAAFINLQLVSVKFKTVEDLNKYMTDKGVTEWQIPSRST